MKIIDELEKAWDIQDHMLLNPVCHHIKIRSDAVIVDFRNRPDSEVVQVLKENGFEESGHHDGRKYIWSSPSALQGEVKKEDFK